MTTEAQTGTTPLTGTWEADPVHSSWGFSVKHMGNSTFRGHLTDVSGRLTETDGRLTLEGSAEVESISIRTPEQFRQHLMSPQFFDIESYPRIDFRSTEVRLTDDSRATVEGELTIKGKTKPVTADGRWKAPSQDAFGNTRAALALETTIDRRDFGFDWNQPLPNGGDAVGWHVTLSVDISLVQGQ